MTESERPPTVGYVVSTWPRLSQTFVLREILAVERLGVPVRIFSTKDPDGEPSHGEVAHVRARVTFGTGPLKPALEAQVQQLGLQDRVTFLGAQPQDVIRLAYRRATVFALPCVVSADGDRDGIPTVLLEAMASGVPVVSTPVSGIPELIHSGRNGLLVAPHDLTMLAAHTRRDHNTSTN